MKSALLLLLLTFFLSLAAFACDDPNLRRGVISDAGMHGSLVGEHAKPVAFTLVWLYSGKKQLYAVSTGKDGTFDFGLVPAGTYRLSVTNRESFEVEVQPDKPLSNGQHWYYHLGLLPHGCINVTQSTN